MTLQKRLTDLEQAVGPKPDAPTRIRVCRIPGDVPRDEEDAWIEAHPECVSKIVEVDPSTGTRVVYISSDSGLG